MNKQDICVAVNVSAVQFNNKDFINTIRSILRETTISSSRIKLEITEGVVVEDITGVKQKLKGLKELGMDISMDDFGTGYSSLSYLNSLPFDQIKIDRSFITELHSNPDALTLAQGVIALGQALRFNVLAEGVETLEQLEIISNMGCEEIQGYYFSKPLPFEQAIDWIHSFRGN